MTIECNPDTGDAGARRGVRGRGNRISLGCSRWCRPCWRSAAPHRSGQRDPCGGRGDRRRDRQLERRRHLRAAGETPTSGRRRSTRCSPSTRPTSAYGLTVEPGTVGGRPGRHPDDDDQADKYLLATERLGDAGLAWYEISNWARPGHACRHNVLYWRQGEYAAIGSAAARPPGRSALLERAHARARYRRRRGRRTPRPQPRPSTPTSTGSRASSSRQAPRRACRRRACPRGRPSLDGLVELRGGRAHLTVPGRLL